MRQGTQRILGLLCLMGLSLSKTPGHAQVRRPSIQSVRDVTCVANWERRFVLIRPGMWQMTMGMSARDQFLFYETNRSRTTISLQSIRNSRLKAFLNLKKQRIKYIIPGQENAPLFFKIQSFNIDGGNC